VISRTMLATDPVCLSSTVNAVAVDAAWNAAAELGAVLYTRLRMVSDYSHVIYALHSTSAVTEWVSEL
jgi:hypothetical protein